MASIITKCLPTEEGYDKCPYISTCLARQTDRTITGCGMPLYVDGFITKSEIYVEHTVVEEKNEYIMDIRI